ncbi:MAG: 50S ribosomal protein L24 [Candidatus Binatia bacterium]
MGRFNLKKDDTVIVVAGRERGKTGKVVSVDREDEHVIVERLNMIKRHRKPSGPQQPGGIVEKEAPLHISNVQLLCPSCEKPTRVGRKTLGAKEGEKAKRARVCVKCGEVLDKG